MSVLVEHKESYRAGVLWVIAGVVTAVGIYKESEGFAFAAYWLVILQLLFAVYLFLKGKSQEILNAEGIIVTSVFRTVTYPWSSVRRYGIDMVYVMRGGKVQSNQKEPKIIVYTETKKLKLVCRDDILQCLAHYKGAPDYDLRK